MRQKMFAFCLFCLFVLLKLKKGLQVVTKEDNLKQKLKTALLLDKTINYSSKEAYYTYTFYCLVSICNHCPPMENNDNSF